MPNLGKHALALFGIAALSGLALAVDQEILGSKLLVKDPTGQEANRAVIGLGRETATDVPALTAPTTSGATLRIITNGTTSTDRAYTLDAAGWSTTGSGFKYSGPTGGDGDPVRKVLLRRTPSGLAFIKIILKGNVGTDTVDNVPPNTADDGGFILEVVGGDRYCVSFGGPAGGTTTRDDASQWKVINATTEPGCPQPATTTSSSTTSTSSTSTTSTSSTSTTSTSSTSTSTTSSSTTSTSETTTSTSTTSTSSTTTTTLYPACGDATAPACDGTCAPGSFCIPNSGACVCTSAAFECQASGALCIGECPGGNPCQGDGTGSCMCAP